MHIYFSGAGGVGIGPLAEIAHQAGYVVSGSDISKSLMTEQLEAEGVSVLIGQDGSQIASVHEKHPIDWFVHTAALPDDHVELMYARNNGIRVSKRDELLAEIIRDKDLKLIAIAGTHGKTTTTGMLLWTLLQRNIAISYSIGTTLGWAPSGKFDPDSRYFLYECDEFDKNFLHFHPSIAIITSIDYDHPDTYPTKQSYDDAFDQFCRQSDLVVGWDTDVDPSGLGSNTILHVINKEKTDLGQMHIEGLHNRQNAHLVYTTLVDHFHDPEDEILHLLETFPGTGRRFERLGEDYSLYSDYGHHPVEIQATLQLAKEAALGSPVALVYQPHQNTRQHQIKELYTPNVFEYADKIYWLPTYLTREVTGLPVLESSELTSRLPAEKVHYVDLNDSLWDTIAQLRKDGYLVLCMGAGTIDAWVRDRLTK